jgi:hypothetical protein
MRCRFFLLAVTTAFLLITSSCRSCDNGSGNSNSRSEILPDKIPPAVNVEYVKSTDGSPPAIKGATNVRQIEAAETLLFTAEQLNALDTLARNNDAIKAQLGDRASLLQSYYLEDKAEPSRRITNLTYYSYSNNYAVEVQVENQRVLKNEILRDFQPPATREEIAKAVSIALENPEIRAAAGQLTSHGIVSYRKFTNREIANHRIIYVSFSRKESDNIEYFAYVDLIQNNIIEHGKDVRSRDDEEFKKEYLRRNK